MQERNRIISYLYQPPAEYKNSQSTCPHIRQHNIAALLHVTFAAA